MSDLLKDGTGKGYTAKVDSENRLHTHAFGVTMTQSAAFGGDNYFISSGILNLSNSSESAIFYLQNISQLDMFMHRQYTLLGPSTGGDGSVIIRFYIGPTGGTIVDNEEAVNAVNSRFLDPKPLDALTYTGGQGETLIGGMSSEFVTFSQIPETNLVIPPSVTFGVSFQPSAGNTSQDVSFGVDVIANASKYGND